MNESVWAVMERMQGEIAAEIRVMLGEVALPQSLFDDEQRRRRIEAMQKCAAESTGDADRHEAWMKMHVESGWVYGEQFDPAAKTHPNLKPWDELTPSTRSKAKIFDIISKTAAQLVAMSSSGSCCVGMTVDAAPGLVPVDSCAAKAGE